MSDAKKAEAKGGAKKRALKELAAKSDTQFDKVDTEGAVEDEVDGKQTQARKLSLTTNVPVGEIIKAVQNQQKEEAEAALSGNLSLGSTTAGGDMKVDGEIPVLEVTRTPDYLPPGTGRAVQGKRHVPDVRVAVVGNVDSGKSTLIGVLTGGQLDNGRGLARARVFVHAHELANGRTSCISHHIMGFDAEHKVVHQTGSAAVSSHLALTRCLDPSGCVSFRGG